FQIDPRLKAIQVLISTLSVKSQHNPQDVTALAAMGREIAPTTLFLIQNDLAHNISETGEPWPLFTLFGQWKAVETEDYLLGASCDGSLSAPSAAIAIDRARAYPLIEALMPHSLGAAVAIAALGEKRAVPFIMAQNTYGQDQREELILHALTAATGQTHIWQDWKAWWEDTGSKQVWK
ncbi:MAG: hypothetical protein M3Y56_10300, partial [Armatimonadota bacterium]|nr:hypothetical protein [Armatimonadota bacterium]